MRRMLGPLLVAAGLATAARARRRPEAWTGSAGRSARGVSRLVAVLEVACGTALLASEGRRPRAVTVSAHIDAPPAAVFAAVADPRKPFLTGNRFTAMTVVGERTGGVGTIYRWTFTLPLGLGFRFDEVVTRWVEPERFAYRAISGWEMEATTTLAAREGGTLVTFWIRFRLPGAWNVVIPRWLAAPGARAALASLRRRVEHGPATDDRSAVAVIAYAADIAAPPAEVFRVVGDPRSKLVWVPRIRRVEMLSGGPLGAGTRYLTSSGAAGLELLFDEEIVEWQPPRRLAYRGESRWGGFLATWRIEPAAGGSHVRYRMDYEFPGGAAGAALGRIIAALVRRPIGVLAAAKVKAAVEQRRWRPASTSP